MYSLSKSERIINIKKLLAVAIFIFSFAVFADDYASHHDRLDEIKRLQNLELNKLRNLLSDRENQDEDRQVKYLDEILRLSELEAKLEIKILLEELENEQKMRIQRRRDEMDRYYPNGTRGGFPGE